MKAAAVLGAVALLNGANMMLAKERELRASIFTPPPKLSVSEWADKYRMLTSVASVEPGHWRTARAEYQRGILDAFSDPAIEQVNVCSSSQIGKTEIILGVIAYFVDQDPAPMLVMQPTLDMARSFSKDRVREMFRATPQLSRFVYDTGRREADDTILHRAFPGGHLTMVGANSAASLAARPIRVLLCDEVDRYPESAGDEGDPVTLGMRRTITFWNRKIGLFSTPTITGASRIDTAFMEGDQRRYYVPCPHCGHLQHLRWEQLDFDTGAYICEPDGGCGATIDEMYKSQMVARGQWIAAKPGGKIASFHVNALLSPWVSWADLITEFKAVKAIPERHRVFKNTMLGLTWDLDTDGADTSALATRAEVYAAEVPMPVGMLTASIDVQHDRLEVLIKGWGKDQESWDIAHHRLLGDPAVPTSPVWAEAEALLVQSYQHESGAPMRITCTTIDSGDGNTMQAVYAFVAPRQKRRIFASKGLSTPGKPVITHKLRKNRYGIRLVGIGTQTAKDTLFGRLKLKEPGPGYIHFPKDRSAAPDAEFFAQFGAEVPVIKRHQSTGIPVRVYKQIRARNEAIDLEVGCLAALHLLGAGIYDHLDVWAARVKKRGDVLRAQQVAAGIDPAAPVQPVPQPQPQRYPMPRPRGPRTGYVHSWKHRR